MTLPRETLLELMALADGELEGPAKERVEKLAAHDAEAMHVVETMRSEALRVWLQQAVAQRTQGADAIADAVMEKLDVRRPALLTSASPRRLRSSRALAAGATLGGALALAASVAFVVHGARERGRGQPAPVASAVAPRVEGSGGAAPPSVVAVAPSPRAPRDEGAPGVEVEEVDSPAHVSIFAIGNASAPSSVVVWIEDEPRAK